LRSIDERVLRRFMRLHGYEITPTTSINDVIKVVIKRPDIRSLLDPPTRLELKSFDPGLEQKIVEQVDHKLTIDDEKLELVDEKTRATQYPLNLIDEKLKSVESFAKGLSLATAFVGLFSFSGGAYTVWKLGELNQRSGQLEAALTNSEIAASHN